MTPEEAYRILDLPPGAPATEAKTAYRKLALELHPDRHRTAGGRDYYGRKFRLVRDAYELLRRRGFPGLPQEPIPGPEHGPRVAGRSFAPAEPPEVPLSEKLGLKPSWNPGGLLLWALLSCGALVLFWFVKFLTLEMKR